MKAFFNRAQEQFFDENQTTTLKGICIILVFINHFFQYTAYLPPKKPLTITLFCDLFNITLNEYILFKLLKKYIKYK